MRAVPDAVVSIVMRRSLSMPTRTSDLRASGTDLRAEVKGFYLEAEYWSAFSQLPTSVRTIGARDVADSQEVRVCEIAPNDSPLPSYLTRCEPGTARAPPKCASRNGEAVGGQAPALEKRGDVLSRDLEVTIGKGK